MQEHGGVSEVHVVEAWHAALNEGDVDCLVGLSHPDVEIGGPRGIGRGVQLLREWVDRANVRLDPRRVFRRGSTVVVEQSGQWRSAESGEVIGSQTVASVFTVCDGLVTSLVRYEDLSQALKTAGLEQPDERYGLNAAREANKENIGVRARRGIASEILAKASACKSRTGVRRAGKSFVSTVLRLRKDRSEGCQKLEK